MALESQLDGRHQGAFLVPRCLHALLKRQGRCVVDIDYAPSGHAFRAQMEACGRFRPDIIVDDLSPAAYLTTRVSSKPRVAIRRTGVFPGGIPRNSAHRHSMCSPERVERFYKNCEAIWGIRPPTNLVEMCTADVNIVPGIRSVEVLPDSLHNNADYIFSGGLTLPDALVPAESPVSPAEISAFCERNRDRKLVYLTVGSILKGGGVEFREMIRYMLDEGAAVISSVEMPDLSQAFREIFFYAPFLPMHHICGKVHLMIHHCGSGTYQYAIRYQIPSICIGSRCYDRDDVAARLEELGVARYIPSARENPEFARTFRERFKDSVDKSGNWYQSAKEKVGVLKTENDLTAAAFDFAAVLDTAVENHHKGRANARLPKLVS